jgi:hypothetical protein
MISGNFESGDKPEKYHALFFEFSFVINIYLVPMTMSLVNSSGVIMLLINDPFLSFAS